MAWTKWREDMKTESNAISAEHIRPSYFKHCPRVEVDMDCDECDYDGRSEDNPAVEHGLYAGASYARDAARAALSSAYFYPPEGEYNPDAPIDNDDGL